MKKLICIIVASLVMSIVLPSFSTAYASARTPQQKNPQSEKLSTDKKSKTMEEDLEDVSVDNPDKPAKRFAPILWWAAGFLGNWLGGKLLNWGVSKFCKKYRNSNAATRTVCSILES